MGPIVSLDQARSGAGFGILLPGTTGYTQPAEVHMIGAQPFTRVTLWYPDGTMLTEFLGEVQPDAFQKIVGGGTTVEPVRVGASRRLVDHRSCRTSSMLLFRDPDGQARWQEVTVSGQRARLAGRPRDAQARDTPRQGRGDRAGGVAALSGDATTGPEPAPDRRCSRGEAGDRPSPHRPSPGRPP